jgi:hypothetical protein
LVKNRKTGISVNATFDFQFGRYFYNAENNNQKSDDSDSGSGRKDFSDPDDLVLI